MSREEYSSSNGELKNDKIFNIDELIYGIAEGKMVCLEKLYEQVSSSVYAYALSIMKNSHAAEDVMQDTFINIVQGAKSYTSQGKPMAWIITITRNLAHMKLQRKENQNSSLEDFVDFASYGDQYSESDKKILINCALNELKDEDRQIVILHAMTGLKHREIAKIMDIPLSTVLTKYKRALEKMKKIIGGDGIE